MESIKIEFNNKFIFTFNPVNLIELVRLFKIRKNGAHFKVKVGNDVRNVWPDENGNFMIPPRTSVCHLIAMEEDEEESNNEPSSNSFPRHARRGNSAFSSVKSAFASGSSPFSTHGTRAIPSLKRKGDVLASCSSSKIKPPPSNIQRIIEVCEIKDDNLSPIFDVPINLAKMTELNVRTIVNEIRNQIGGRQYVLLNKKGNFIRGMPNTRGMSIIFSYFFLWIA